MLRGLWTYRYFVVSSIRHELLTRFARGKLGGLWMIINPLAQVAIYALILSNVLSARLPELKTSYGYAIYLLSGLLAWSLLSEIISRCVGLFIEQGGLMKKISFPRITLPMIAVGSSVLNNAFLIVATLGIFFILGHELSFAMLWLLPIAMALIVFALGVGLILGIVNVFVRDVGQVMPIVLQMWFWLTPIVYPINIVPEQYRVWLTYNPVYAIFASYQDVLVYGRSPNFEAVFVFAGASLLIAMFSVFLFRRASEEMVDVL